jgi:hypothetical protein
MCVRLAIAPWTGVTSATGQKDQTMRQELRVASLLAFVFACGSEQKPQQQGSPSTGSEQLEVHPAAVQLAAKAVQQFTFSPTTVQVAWSVTETGGGSITQGGVYTAPAFSGVFHVVATSTTNAAASAQAVVTVDSGIRVVVTSPVDAFACEAVALTATVSGSADTGVIWTAPASCGSVTSVGVFTSTRGTGTCPVTAQAHADPAKSATITVNVAQERVLSVAIVPAAASLGTGGSQGFGANVTTACGTFPAGS